MVMGSSFAQGPLSVAPGATVGSALAAFELTTLEGQSVRLESFRGRPLLIHFFAIQCEPCREETLLLRTLGQAAYRHGYEILGIAVQDTIGPVSRYARDNGWAFPIALDAENRMRRTYYVRGLPATLFVDRYGVLRDRVVGPLTAERTRAAFERLGLPF